MNKEEFLKELNNLNVSLNDEILNKLKIYCDYLLEYNKNTNLTAIKEENEVYLKHFYDSISLAKIIDLNKVNTVLDIGSGAGFPGVVIKIFYPNIDLTLIDSNNKKTLFLSKVVELLNLDNVKVINNRVEKMSKDYLNSFDLVTARAVSDLNILVELALPLVKKDSYFIAMKANYEEELKRSMYAIEYMAGNIEKILEFELPKNAGKRALIKIKKIRNTDISELRSYDKIIKKPLQKRDK